MKFHISEVISLEPHSSGVSWLLLLVFGKLLFATLL